MVGSKFRLVKESRMTRHLDKAPREQLKAYALDQKLAVICSFVATLVVTKTRKAVEAKFFVVEGSRIPLISYQTASKLNLVKVGIDKEDLISHDCFSIFRTTLPPQTEEGEYEDEVEFPKIPDFHATFRVLAEERMPSKQVIRYRIPKALEKSENERITKMLQRRCSRATSFHGYLRWWQFLKGNEIIVWWSTSGL